MGLSKLLAVVVIMAHDLTNSSDGSRHVSHSPAKANGSPEAIVILYGVLLEPLRRHS
jgi:hypothetical protein